MGFAGEFEWAVMAHLDKDAAVEHAANAERRANEIFALSDGRHIPEGVVNEFDAYMRMDYTGTHYLVYEVPLASKRTGKHPRLDADAPSGGG